MEMVNTDTARMAFFNERAHSWLDRHYKNPETGNHDLHAKQISGIVSTLDIQPDFKILDMGCGSGVMVPYILKHLSSEGQLFETDFALQMIRANRKEHYDDRISFICSHVMDLPFEESFFDAVICFACFPHFQNQRAALKKIAGTLKPGKRLTIAHLLSSEQISLHHSGDTAVCHDELPSGDKMEAFCKESGLIINEFRDEPGKYLLVAEKISAEKGVS